MRSDRTNRSAVSADPRVLDVVGTPAVVVDLRMEKIDLPAESANRRDVRSSREADPSPVLQDHSREHLVDNVVPHPQIVVTLREPQVRS